MAKLEHRHLETSMNGPTTQPRAPAWFDAQPVDHRDGHWDWLDEPRVETVEVTEFAVTDGFIAALFGLSIGGAPVAH